MLEKSKLNFDDLFSKLEPVVKNVQSEKKEESPLSRLFNKLLADEKEGNKREELIKSIFKEFDDEQKLGNVMADQAYAGVFKLSILSIFMLLLSFMLFLTDKGLGLSGLNLNTIPSGFSLVIAVVEAIFSVGVVAKLAKFIHSKTYNRLYDKRNQKHIDNFKEQISKIFGQDNMFKVEYYYHLNKFEGGLENKRNLLFLTYLINKYGLEEKEIKECALDYKMRIPYYNLSLTSIRDFKMWMFKRKTDKKVDWDELSDEINKLQLKSKE